MAESYEFNVVLPDRHPDEPDATPFQQSMMLELGTPAHFVSSLGVDQASELIRASVIGHVAWTTLALAHEKPRGILDPEEPIKRFTKHFELPDRKPDELSATECQARILRELQVQEEVCGLLGVDQASVLIRDVARKAMEKRQLATLRRATRTPAI